MKNVAMIGLTLLQQTQTTASGHCWTLAQRQDLDSGNLVSERMPGDFVTEVLLNLTRRAGEQAVAYYEQSQFEL